MENSERIFSILNKVNRVWINNPKLKFCELYKLISEGKKLTDLQFSRKLDKYIEENNIK